jgi:hypothetical protein
LEENSVIKDFLITAKDGKQYLSPEKLVGLYKTIAFLESKSLSGKLKGKITLKLTEELEQNN